MNPTPKPKILHNPPKMTISILVIRSGVFKSFTVQPLEFQAHWMRQLQWMDVGGTGGTHLLSKAIDRQEMQKTLLKWKLQWTSINTSSRTVFRSSLLIVKETLRCYRKCSITESSRTLPRPMEIWETIHLSICGSAPWDLVHSNHLQFVGAQLGVITRIPHPWKFGVVHIKELMWESSASLSLCTVFRNKCKV